MFLIILNFEKVQTRTQTMSLDNGATAHESEPWFKATMTRDDAEQYLRAQSSTKAFVVRNSSHPGALTLSCRLKSGEVTHTHISRVDGGWWMPKRGREILAPSVRQLLLQCGILPASPLSLQRRVGSTLFSADEPQRPAQVEIVSPRVAPSALRRAESAPAPMSAESAFSASLKLAFAWGLAQLACFYTDAAEESNLAPLAYLIRTSTTNGDSLVLAVRDGITNELARILVRRVSDNLWQAGIDSPIEGTFANFIRKVLPHNSVPHYDPTRAQQQRVQSTHRAHATAGASLEQRVQNHAQQRSSARFASNNHMLLVQDGGGSLGGGGDRASIRAVSSPGVSESAHSSFAGDSVPGDVRQSKSRTYGSISAALQAARVNDDHHLSDGTVWTGVARAEALAALDAKHDDVDGVSLAGEVWYFFDMDTFGANAILAGLEVGSFLVRLNSSSTQFVVSFVRQVETKPAHILLQVDRAHRTVTTQNARTYASVRHLVSEIDVFRTPVSRLAYAREFVDCTIVLTKQPLGVGAGGVVLRGRLDGAFDVAVKRLRQSAEEIGDSERLAEAEAMLRVPPHPNVNRLYGLVLKPLSIVIEFCDRGSLDQLLGIENVGYARGEMIVLSTSDVWRLALDIARGVAHLHQARVVHRDLATRNILISSPFIPKVCDFGMSRLLDEDETAGTTEELRGPIKWQAPEQLRGRTRRVFSFKSDVFSFAVLLTEIVNRRLPWHDCDNRSAAIEVVSGARTVVDSHCTPALRTIIQRCWATAPDDRPTMADVCAMLDRPMPVVYDEVEVEQAPVVSRIYDDIGDL
jgi:serine/threonine protein kinase